MENNVGKNCDEWENFQMGYQANLPSSKEVYLSSEHDKIHKTHFHFHGQNSGNILTVHHTIKENNKLLRIVLSVCCFDLRGTQMLTIDRRGNIFVFDLSNKRFWQHPEIIKKPSVAVASIKEPGQYVVGTKEGILVVLDVDNEKLLHQRKISEEIIREISFPGQPLEPKNLALICTGTAALLIDLTTSACSYRLDFDKVTMSLKFASFLPNSEYVLTAFTNDTIHIWSGVTLEVVRVVQPLKLRDKKLSHEVEAKVTIPEFSLDDISSDAVVMPIYCSKNFVEGSITCYAYQNDSYFLFLSTWDNFLLSLNVYTFELCFVYRLKDFILLQIAILSKPNDNFIVGLTNRRMVVLLDKENIEFKLVISTVPTRYLSISPDAKYLSISQMSGELSIWSLCDVLAVSKSQKKCMSLFRKTFNKTKPLKISSTECRLRIQHEIKKLLTPQRLQQILQEYNCYPAKYRTIIWCSLLQLPNNIDQYRELIQMGIPQTVALQSRRILLKNATLKRALVKCWSCLGQWCKVLAHSDTVPGLIFPFVKMFQQNPVTAFEFCSTLIHNHFQLFFEYHPLEPSNYLGICSNILQYFDKTLYEFYREKEITATIYAWSLVKTSFSEVLDENQWMCLWDNVLSAPLYYLIFLTVAYNILQKEVIIRLPDKNVIQIFFREQNPICVNKLTSKAYKLLQKCPDQIHPKKYFSQFQRIPPNVYPKFLKFPRKCLNSYEEKVEDLNKVHAAMDVRMRELELEELDILRKLENGLRQEEQTKRLKEIEQFYANTLKREEERVNCQRKMLLLYQKEIRQRKGEIVSVLQESAKRKDLLQKERELNCLQNQIEKERLRNDLNLMVAEEELHDQNIELLSQKTLKPTLMQPLSYKYYDDIKRLGQEQKLLNNDIKIITSNNLPLNNMQKTSTNYLDDVERKLDGIQEDFLALKSTTYIQKKK